MSGAEARTENQVLAASGASCRVLETSRSVPASGSHVAVERAWTRGLQKGCLGSGATGSGSRGRFSIAFFLFLYTRFLRVRQQVYKVGNRLTETRDEVAELRAVTVWWSKGSLGRP